MSTMITSTLNRASLRLKTGAASDALNEIASSAVLLASSTPSSSLSAAETSGPVPFAANRPRGIRSSPASATRYLSTHGQDAVGRFREALEEYRVKNYAQTIPTRFKKEIITSFKKTTTSTSFPPESTQTTQPQTAASVPAAPGDDPKQTAVREIEGLLKNIGAFGRSSTSCSTSSTSSSQITHNDVETIVSEIGDELRLLDVDEEIRAEMIVTKLL